jgi:transcriptional regulator with XRE-family HTH domain
LPPVPPARAAREAFGARLREIRRDAGLTGRALARQAGWAESKVSKIEYGHRPPSQDDVKAWAVHCGVPDQLPDLLAALRAVEGMYVEFRNRRDNVLRRSQLARSEQYDRTTHWRIYEPYVIPGLFQTHDYALAHLQQVADFHDNPEDVGQAVAVRLNNQRVLRQMDRRFAVVLEEAALYARIGTTDMMAAQLGHLLIAGTLSNVSLGIVPLDIDRSVWSPPGFWMFDDAEVVIENPTAELTITQPREIAVYERIFAELMKMAAVGPAARALIVNAINRLGV